MANGMTISAAEATWGMIILFIVLTIVVFFFCCVPTYKAIQARYSHWEDPENDPRWNVDQFQFSPTSPRIQTKNGRGMEDQFEVKLPPAYADICSGSGEISSLGTPPAYTSEPEELTDKSDSDNTNTPIVKVAAKPKEATTEPKPVPRPVSKLKQAAAAGAAAKAALKEAAAVTATITANTSPTPSNKTTVRTGKLLCKPLNKTSTAANNITPTHAKSTPSQPTRVAKSPLTAVTKSAAQQSAVNNAKSTVQPSAVNNAKSADTPATCTTEIEKPAQTAPVRKTYKKIKKPKPEEASS